MCILPQFEKKLLKLSWKVYKALWFKWRLLLFKKFIEVYFMLKLKLQYFGHLMWRADLFEKTLMLGNIEGRRRGRQKMKWLDGITDSMDMVWVDCGSWWWTGRPGVLQFMGLQRIGHDWGTELNWTDYVIGVQQRESLFSRSHSIVIKYWL